MSLIRGAVYLALALVACAVAFSELEVFALQGRSMDEMVQLSCLLVGAFFLPLATHVAWGSKPPTWQFYIVYVYVSILFVIDLSLLAFYPETTVDVSKNGAASLARYGNMVSLMIGVSFTISVTISAIANKQTKEGNHTLISGRGPTLVFNALFLGVLLTAPVLEGVEESKVVQYLAYVVKPGSLFALCTFLIGLTVETSEIGNN